MGPVRHGRHRAPCTYAGLAVATIDARARIQRLTLTMALVSAVGAVVLAVGAFSLFERHDHPLGIPLMALGVLTWVGSVVWWIRRIRSLARE
jgi:hypothetical protein